LLTAPTATERLRLEHLFVSTSDTGLRFLGAWMGYQDNVGLKRRWVRLAVV